MDADLLVELRGLHDLPVTLGTLISDGVTALALGLLVAWIVVQVVALFSTREVSPETRALQRLAEVGQTDGENGLAARARLLLDLGRDLPEGEGDVLQRVDRHLDGFLATGKGKVLREALYRPDVAVDLVEFDHDLTLRLRQAER